MPRILVPVEDKSGIDARIADHFNRAPYYAIVEVDERLEVKRIGFIENPRHRGLNPAEYFTGFNIDLVIVRRSAGSKAIEPLKSRGTRVLSCNSMTIAGALREIREGKAIEL